MKIRTGLTTTEVLTTTCRYTLGGHLVHLPVATQVKQTFHVYNKSLHGCSMFPPVTPVLVSAVCVYDVSIDFPLPWVSIITLPRCSCVQLHKNDMFIINFISFTSSLSLTITVTIGDSFWYTWKWWLHIISTVCERERRKTSCLLKLRQRVLFICYTDH